jgi:hypothetical protein
VSGFDLDGQVVAEEDARPGEVADPVRPLPADYPETSESGALVLRPEVRTAAIAAAGGVLAGAATVAAVRAVTGAASRSRSRSPRLRRRERQNVIASRSFLVDVHLLGR